MVWSKRVAIENWTLYDSWTNPDPKAIFGKSKLRKSVFVSPPAYCGRERLCVCLYFSVCVWFVLCRSTCVTLLEDELRQREKRNAVVFIIAQETWHVCSRAHTHTHTLGCGAVKPQHNDPQLLVCRKLLSAGQNKVLTPYACDSSTLLHLRGFYMHQSITFTCCLWRLNRDISKCRAVHTKHSLDYVVYRHAVR